MGIKHLNRFLRQQCPAALKLMSFSQLRGKTICIDASIYLYKYSKNDLLLQKLSYLLQLFRFHHISPLFVFDGKAPQEKKAVLQQRSRERRDAEQHVQECQTALQSSHMSSPERHAVTASLLLWKEKSITITRDTIQQVKLLLDSYRVPYMVAPGEADALCASLVLENRAWACASEDMDLFVYGCPRVLRYMSLVKQNAVCYDMSDILQELHVTQSEFRDICVVAGTDYGGGMDHTNNNNSSITVETVWDLFQDYASSSSSSFLPLRNRTFHEWLVTHTEHTFVPPMDLLRLRKIASMFDCCYHPNQLSSITVTS
jgi:5'-3' exonuclease